MPGFAPAHGEIVGTVLLRVNIIWVDWLGDEMVDRSEGLGALGENARLEDFIGRGRFVSDAGVDFDLLCALVDEFVGVFGTRGLEELLVDATHIHLLLLLLMFHLPL